MAEETRQVISQLGYEGEIYDIYDEKAHERIDAIPEGLKIVPTTSNIINYKNNEVYIKYIIASDYEFLFSITTPFGNYDVLMDGKPSSITTYTLCESNTENPATNYRVISNTATITSTLQWVCFCSQNYDGMPIAEKYVNLYDIAHTNQGDTEINLDWELI